MTACAACKESTSWYDASYKLASRQRPTPRCQVPPNLTSSFLPSPPSCNPSVKPPPPPLGVDSKKPPHLGLYRRLEPALSWFVPPTQARLILICTAGSGGVTALPPKASALLDEGPLAPVGPLAFPVWAPTGSWEPSPLPVWAGAVELPKEAPAPSKSRTCFPLVLGGRQQRDIVPQLDDPLVLVGGLYQVEHTSATTVLGAVPFSGNLKRRLVQLVPLSLRSTTRNPRSPIIDPYFTLSAARASNPLRKGGGRPHPQAILIAHPQPIPHAHPQPILAVLPQPILAVLPQPIPNAHQPPFCKRTSTETSTSWTITNLQAGPCTLSTNSLYSTDSSLASCFPLSSPCTSPPGSLTGPWSWLSQFRRPSRYCRWRMPADTCSSRTLAMPAPFSSKPGLRKHKLGRMGTHARKP
eukprot:jgi/Botrbrau1/7556/Bobra.0159s0006.1